MASICNLGATVCSLFRDWMEFLTMEQSPGGSWAEVSDPGGYQCVGKQPWKTRCIDFPVTLIKPVGL